MPVESQVTADSSSWWQKNITPAAAYTIGAVVLSAVVTITTFIVSNHHDKQDMGELKEQAHETNKRLAAIETDVGKIQQWEHDMEEGSKVKNPYVKRKPR